jgi:hypothetical protein
MASYPLLVTLEGVTRDINLYTVPGVLLTRLETYHIHLFGIV